MASSQHLFFCKKAHCDNEVFGSETLCDWCAHPCITCGCTVEFRDGELVCGCDTCKVNGCVYGDDEDLRDLAERFYLGNCYAETDEGYAAACRWYDGDLGEIDEKTRASLLVTLHRWHSCSGEIDYERGIKICDEPFCAQMTLEDVIIEIKNCKTMLTWDRPYEQHVLTQQSLERLRKQQMRFGKLCADCGKKSKDGRFPCYRGEDPLCSHCEYVIYGPPE